MFNLTDEMIMKRYNSPDLQVIYQPSDILTSSTTVTGQISGTPVDASDAGAPERVIWDRY